jgi:hypothetical protein
MADHQRLGDRQEDLLDFLGQHPLNLLGRDRLVKTPFPDGRRDLGRKREPEIGPDQHFLDLLQHGGIELALGGEIGNRARNGRRGPA